MTTDIRIYEAICLRDWSVEAANGDRQELKHGTTYTIGNVRHEETVMVYSRFWVRAPAGVFEPSATWRELRKPFSTREASQLADDMELNIQLTKEGS